MVMLNDLEKSAKITLSLKIFGLVLLLLTTIIVIAKVTYTASGIEAVLTLTSLNATLEVITGFSSSLQSSLNSTAINVLFVLPIIFIGISFVFLFMDKKKISTVFHVVGLGFLFIYF